VLIAGSGDASSALGAVYESLAPNGQVVLLGASDDIKTPLLLAGFVDAQPRPFPAASGPGEDLIALVARRPQWEAGAAAAVSIARPPATATLNGLGQGKATVSVTATWKLAADDMDDEDLVDPDSLLDDGLTLPAKPQARADTDDCGPGGAGAKKRACKNCTCGRAEQEEGDAPVVTDEELQASVSSCGNCYKGDAFRCGGCPFLGKPAFAPGQEKVMLQLQADA
jgi:anamorsin